MSSQFAQEAPILLETQTADRGDRRLAYAAAFTTAVAFFALAPFASVQLPRVPLFLPVYQSALITCELVTAIFLYGRFAAGGSRAQLVLASGYLFSAAMAVFHALTFPGLFSASGLFGAGEQTTAWIYFLWHLGFPGAVIAYALMAEAPAEGGEAPGSGVGVQIAGAAGAALVVASLLAWLTMAGHDVLPAIMRGDEDRPAKYVVAWTVWLVTLAALPLLWRRGRFSLLDLWLMVVIAAWLCDVAQAAVFNSGRFSLGWYAGRAYGLLAATFLLAVLILEESRLYGRLMRSYAAERRQRRLVEQRTEQLDTLNHSLEERVAERTAELGRLNADLRRSQAELRELADLGARAREQERAHLARELHDELNQALIVLRNDLGTLLDRSVDDAPALRMIVRMQQLVDGMLAAAKRIAANLRPPVLDVIGLGGGAEWLVDRLRDEQGIACHLVVEPVDLEVPEPISTAVFRILQEALANVARHAEASRVDVSLRHRDGLIRLCVSDDGRGFDTQAPRTNGCFGLLGMRERVDLSSGWIEISSAPGSGTRIDVTIPLDDSTSDAPERDGAARPPGRAQSVSRHQT